MPALLFFLIFLLLMFDFLRTGPVHREALGGPVHRVTRARPVYRNARPRPVHRVARPRSVHLDARPGAVHRVTSTNDLDRPSRQIWRIEE